LPASLLSGGANLGKGALVFLGKLRRYRMAKVITVMSKTIKIRKYPDIIGFVEEMKKLGAKVTKKDNTIKIDFT